MLTGQDNLRIAVIGSHRSGTTWTRSLLGGLYELTEVAVHDPEAIDWENLPARCILQMHVHPVEWLVKRLDENGFRCLVTSRHPFDILISWLNYNYYVHQEGFCPGGGACTECAIVGVDPRSEEFVRYASGPSGHLLLSFSASWWTHNEKLNVRYEDLVADPEPTLTRLISEIGVTPRRSIADLLAETSIKEKKSVQAGWHYHFWQGRPGLWRDLLTADVAGRIHAGVPHSFRIFGYPCDPNPDLQPLEAELNWLRLQLVSSRDHLNVEHQKHRKTREQIAALQAENRSLLAAPANLQARLESIQDRLSEINDSFREMLRHQAETSHDLAHARAELAAMKERFGPYEDLGPRMLRFAQRTKRLARRFVA